MLKLSTVQVWVNDMEESLAWYTKVLGLEVRTDITVAEMGDFRWLTVGPTDQPDIEIVLMPVPGEPVFTAETKGQIEGLMAKGASGGLFFTTDDVQARFEELSAQGVEFTQEPTQMPYGIDCGFRDPSGNHFRLTQLADISQFATK
jgi:catechol 2,3-dioxygenase-like lactoylglutathione lyase family enzyme